MYQKPEEIAFSVDIAKDLSKELGLSTECILEHIDFLVHWIKKLTEDPEIVNIYIPSIGSLYANWNLMENAIPILEAENEYSKPYKKERAKTFSKRLDRLRKEFEGHVGHIRHKTRSKITSRYYSKGMSLEELEVWQNKQ